MYSGEEGRRIIGPAPMSFHNCLWPKEYEKVIKKMVKSIFKIRWFKKAIKKINIKTR